MRWRDRKESSNVEDRRGVRPGRAVGGGIGIVFIVIIAMLFGVDPGQLIQMLDEPAEQDIQVQSRSPEEDELAKFVSVVLADTEDTWHEIFRSMGKTYSEPKLVLFSGAVDSACGFAQSAMGPFYCPGDHKVYIDLRFYREMKQRFKAPGDFAQAYVIAHEVGHHVQNLLGILPQVHRMQQQVDKVEANRLLVKLELQADCLAGVWGYHAGNTRKLLEHGDAEEALNAASSLGDDRIQKQTQGYVVPDSFTHGTSAQRAGWFRRGFESGDISMCNTFSAKQRF
ncbi:MAG: neutral zinc metallopeptidase [Desulfobacterales bacterium]